MLVRLGGEGEASFERFWGFLSNATQPQLPNRISKILVLKRWLVWSTSNADLKSNLPQLPLTPVMPILSINEHFTVYTKGIVWEICNSWLRCAQKILNCKLFAQQFLGSVTWLWSERTQFSGWDRTVFDRDSWSLTS